MTKDDLIREAKASRGSWPGLVFVYGMILGTLVLTGISAG